MYIVKHDMSFEMLSDSLFTVHEKPEFLGDVFLQFMIAESTVFPNRVVR